MFLQSDFEWEGERRKERGGNKAMKERKMGVFWLKCSSVFGEKVQ